MWYAPDNFLMLFSYGQIPTMGTVKDLNGSPIMGATIIVKNNAGLLGSISNERREVTKCNFLGGPYTVIAQYLVYQESIQEVLP
jgi:hypothetical protein